ncbi:MAG TPA: phage major capsid protein [Chloroflexota bacterium]|nr:phage major capsid protein [Chloroflexota bacterium]
MALTLLDAARLSRDLLFQGVIETVIEESPILQLLPFETIQGNSLKYTYEVAPGTASFYAVNAPWTEGTAELGTRTATLAILGGDVDVDNFLARTMSDVVDQRATQLALKAKAVQRAFERAFITGDAAVDPHSFDGLRKLIPASQTLDAGANGASLTLALLDQLIDMVRGGKPHLLLMSRRTRRKLKSLLVSSTHYVESVRLGEFGAGVLAYDGIPVAVSDYVPDDETLGSGSNLSSIYALRFGWGEGLCGLQNGGIEVVEVGQLETKDAVRTRLRWYVGLALFRDNACARLRGLTAN